MTSTRELSQEFNSQPPFFAQMGGLALEATAGLTTTATTTSTKATGIYYMWGLKTNIYRGPGWLSC